MPALRFVLSPQHCARLYDALNCLAKFSEVVCVEARFSQLLLSALNSSKSAYALFTFTKDGFFSSYDFDEDAQLPEDRFTCSLLNRALASVFKGRLADAKSGDGGIEKCEAVFEDSADGRECRLIMKLVYPQGINKTFKLTYEAAEMMQAVFDKSRAANSWTAPARMLRELSEYFGPKTEQLDICAEGDQVTLTSYTEKIMHGKETLKQPLQTSITLDTSDFDRFDMQPELRIAINIKDFRNIIAHADTLRAKVSTMYSQPTQPLQFSYAGEGMRCEFTLMTIGEYRGSTPAVSRAATREPATRPANVPSLTSRISDAGASIRSATSNRPGTQQKLGRRLPSQPSHGTDSTTDPDPDSLFIPPANDDDTQWQPIDEREGDTDTLGWDTNADPDSTMQATFRDGVAQPITKDKEWPEDGLMPTQRASDVRGLFD